MPAFNLYHDAVIHALQADGWQITDDPLVLSYGGRNVYVDLGAQRVTIGAERNGERIAVEVHSFLSSSPIHDLEQAIGQIDTYRSILAESEAERTVYLAVSRDVFDGIFSEPFGQLIVRRLELKLIVFDEEQERIVQWIN